MKARVNQAGALRYIGGSGTSLGVMMDVSATPESVTPLSILSMEMQQSVEAIVVELEAVRADEPPKVLPKIHASFTAAGDVSLRKVEMTEITHEIKVVTGNAKPCLPISPSA